jgi:hypothetical protein
MPDLGAHARVDLWARPDTGVPLPLPGVGYCENVRVVARDEAAMSLVATTEAGEFLLQCLREGKAEMVAQFDRRPQPGVRYRGLKIAIRFLDEKAHGTWLFRLNRSSVVAEAGGAHAGPGPVEPPNVEEAG